MERAETGISSLESRSISMRTTDPRYHMGSYGTCRMDSIHGRLFELTVYIEALKFHTMMNFVFVLIALTLWPIAALLAIPVSLLAGRDKLMDMFKLFLVLATAIGVVLWSLPIVIVCTGGGVEKFYHLVMVTKQLTFLDFVDMFLSEFMILLTVVFSWVYHEISIDVAKYKQATKQSWKRRHNTGEAQLGLHVDFSKSEVERFTKMLPAGEKLHSARDSKAPGGSLFIEEIIHLLEVCPGWTSEFAELDDYFKRYHMERGLFSQLAELSDEAAEKNIWPIDIWLVNTQYYYQTDEHTMSVKQSLTIALCTTAAMIATIFKFMTRHKHRFGVITVLALIRTMLPRFWLKFVNDGFLWPPEPLSPQGLMVGYSTLVSFVVGWCFISLFFCILMDYRHNLVQMVGVSALIDPNMRVMYSQNYLMSNFWFGLGSAECEEILSRMPLLDFSVSSNVAAFWRLREYTTLDASNERMAISILLEIVIIWMLLKFLTVVTIMYISESLPAVLSVMLFDLAVFGVMIIIALETALKMNSIMDVQKKAFVEGKYMITNYLTKLGDSKEDEARKHELHVSRKLLSNYLDMVNEYDSRDQILFGMTVTGGKIMSSAFTVGAAIWTLLRQAMASGQLKAPEVLEDVVVKQVAVPALVNVTHLISNHMTSFLGKAHLG